MSNPLPVQVRPARAGDAGEVFILVQELATTFVPTKRKFVESLSRLCANDDALVLVAEETGGELAGYLLGFRYDTFHADGLVTLVEELCVRPDARGSGVGRTLILEFEAWSRTSGGRLVAVATRRARAFYESIGFESRGNYLEKRI
jgi:ribosomal protein S18 acetylase RimI-like enzyme